jgi:shikimate kinase
MNVFLIGYRGSGKSTVAAALSQRLDWPWIDSDAEIERQAGMSIKQIFAERGQTAFRDLESLVLAELAVENRRIIALGGGAVLRPANRHLLATRGRTVWLQASPETLLARITGDPLTPERRPNLTASGGLDEICMMLSERTPVYEECADLVVDSENRPADEIAGEIIAGLSLVEFNRGPGSPARDGT